MFEVKTLSTEEIVAKVKAHCAGAVSYTHLTLPTTERV